MLNAWIYFKISILFPFHEDAKPALRSQHSGISEKQSKLDVFILQTLSIRSKHNFYVHVAAKGVCESIQLHSQRHCT